MSDSSCPRATTLAGEARAHPLDAEERSHALVCGDCAAALASAASTAFGEWLVATAHLPSARQTLLRARLEARRREAERRLRPLAIWQAVVLAVAVAAALWLVPPVIGALSAAAASTAAASPAHLVLASGLALLVGLPVLAASRRRAL